MKIISILITIVFFAVITIIALNKREKKDESDGYSNNRG